MSRNLTPEPVATGSAETRIGQLRWREYGGPREAAGDKTLLLKTLFSVVIIERRPQTPVTQSEPVENSETVEEVKPVNPFVKLKKLGKDKPFRDPDEDRYL